MHEDDYTPEQWARIFGVPVERVWRNTQPSPRPHEAANAPEIEPEPDPVQRKALG